MSDLLTIKLFKALYFGGSSWNISWLHYVLGPMKCSGKQQPYPSEIEAIDKKRKEKQFADVIDQAEVNKKNLKVLDEQIHSEAKNLTDTFKDEIDNVEENLRNKNHEFNERLKSLTNEIIYLRGNFTENLNRVEKQSMTRFTGLSSQIGTQSTATKVRPSHFIRSVS